MSYGSAVVATGRTAEGQRDGSASAGQVAWSWTSSRPPSAELDLLCQQDTVV